MIKAEEGVQEVSYRMDALEAPMTAEELAALGEGPEVKPEEEVKVEEKTAEELLEEGKAAEQKVEAELTQAKVEGATAAEVAELRGMLREMRQDNIRLAALVSEHDRVQKGEVGKDSDPAVIETLNQDYQKVISNTTHFENLLAVMEINPKFEDVHTVCSQQHFEDIFEMLATHRAGENKSSFNEEYLRAKIEVWGQPNPYKFMYELIKEYHPAYQKEEEAPKKEEPAKKEEAPKSAADVVKAKKPVDAPGSVASLGGGGGVEQAGWTATRIDAMPETDLHKVPRDVYAAYLRGELDS